MDLAKKQNQIISEAKKYISDNSNSINTALSTFCFFGTWDETPGWSKIKLIDEGWKFFPKYLKVILKNFLGIGFLNDYTFQGNNLTLKEKKRDTLVISWAYKNNFNPDGSFTDTYLKENSKNHQNILWVAISLDNYVPENLHKNVVIIKRKKRYLRFSMIFLLKTFFGSLIQNKFSLKKIAHYLSSNSIIAFKINKIITKKINIDNFSKILLPYEAQPFQNYLFDCLKKQKKNLKTIGYLHAVLPSVPINYLNRNGAPDLLLVHGQGQKDILNELLGWPQNKTKLIQSLRFRENIKTKISNKIFIPYGLFNYDILLLEFEKFLNKTENNLLPHFEISNHRAKMNSKDHIDFITKLKKIIKKNENKFSQKSKKRNLSLCFGWTAAIIEILERGCEVIHICSDPKLDAFNEKIWKNLNVKRISDFTFEYQLLSNGSYIDFGKNKDLLNQVLEEIK